jgi:hypothetical protein
MESTDSDRVTVAIHNESYGLVLKAIQEVDSHVKAVCEDLIRKAAVPVGHDRGGECQQVNRLPVTEYEYDDYLSTEPEPKPDIKQSLGGDSGACSSGDSDPPSGRDSDAPSAGFSGENHIQDDDDDGEYADDDDDDDEDGDHTDNDDGYD